MSSILKLLEKNPDFFRQTNPAFPFWNKVHQQSVIHTRRAEEKDKNPIIEDFRPHETNMLKDYRIKHERQFTRAGFEMFVAKVSRTVKQCVQATSTISETLQEWIGKNPFLYLGESKTLDRFVVDVIAKRALENPNQLLIAFPYRASDPYLPPIMGDSDVRVDIKPLLVSHFDIRWTDNNCFSFEDTQEMEVPYEGKIVKQKVYFSCDSQYWYQHRPLIKKEEGKPVLYYETIIWYQHDTGESLLNFLSGEYTCSRSEDIHYLESYIRSYYSLADAAMSAFSDEFIVNSRYSYPIPEIRPTKCHVAGYEGGYINNDRHNPCRECVEGYVLWPGPSGALVSPDDSHNILDEKSNTNKPAITWHNPEMGFADHAYKRAFDLLNKAYQSIGLNLYGHAGANASGEALREWKEDEHDKLLRVVDGLFATMDRFLYQCECLLVPSRESRIRPKTVIPERIATANVHDLKEQARNALPEDRLFSHKMYLKKKYGDDPIMTKAHAALLCYTPYMYEDLEVIKLNMDKNICTKEDMIKRQWGAIAIDYVVESMGQEIIRMSKDDIHNMMDQWFFKKKLLSKEETTEKKTISKDRISELQAIVGLNRYVQEGSITKTAAELLLVRQFGYRAEEAKEIMGSSVSSSPAFDKLEYIMNSIEEGVISREEGIRQLSIETSKSIVEVGVILDKYEIQDKFYENLNPAQIRMAMNGYRNSINHGFYPYNRRGLVETPTIEGGELRVRRASKELRFGDVKEDFPGSGE